jgi:hypothetical protein
VSTRQKPKLVPINKQSLIGNRDNFDKVPVRRVNDAWGKASGDTILIPGNFGSAPPVESSVSTRQKPKLVPINSQSSVAFKEDTKKAPIEPVRINDGMKDIYYYAEKRKQENLKAQQNK